MQAHLKGYTCLQIFYPPKKTKKKKKDFQSFLGIMNYLTKYYSANAKICKPLKRLTSVKVDWNKIYEDLYRAKTLTKKCVYAVTMKGSHCTYKLMYLVVG